MLEQEPWGIDLSANGRCDGSWAAAIFTVTLLHNKQLVNKSIERKSSGVTETMWSFQRLGPRHIRYFKIIVLIIKSDSCTFFRSHLHKWC